MSGILNRAMIVNRAEAVLQPAAPVGRLLFPQLPGGEDRRDSKPLLPIGRLLYPQLPGDTGATANHCPRSAGVRCQAEKYNPLRGTTRYVPLKKEPEKPAGFSGIFLSQSL